MLQIWIADEDEAGRPVMPLGFLNYSEHTSEEKAQASGARCSLAVAILKYVTGTNRPRFRVLVPSMPSADFRALRASRT